MNKRYRLYGLVLGIVTLSVYLFSNTSKDIDPDEISKALEYRINQQKAVGYYVGVIDGAQEYELFLGRTSNENIEAITKKHIFEIGSITKTMTGILLANMVESGAISYNDKVSDYLPIDFKGQVGDITLLELATHSSGLARMPDNFFPNNPLNPYVDYYDQDLKAYLENLSVLNDGTEYSNLGFGLLGYILSVHAEMPFEDLLIDKVIKPIGMTDTTITVSSELENRFVNGHNEDGKITDRWDFNVLAGAGGVRSTGVDMLKYLKANMGLVDTGNSPALIESHKPRRDFIDENMNMGPDKEVQIGLGWFVQTDDNNDITWSFGRTGGFRSFIGWDKNNNRGIVILTNSMDSPHHIGMSILLGHTDRLYQ
ncbi:serine hydrolase domain-containing protein [Pseudemcibacter aquimaris]|uniref:serine hydrolase domain-containing protein n=1 Tax=Pseudemcibacter aquimaris TaxID=2857064 RepID=UPI002013605B|nr:serine hydrolase domain-containing protein [Pseudemcibacter aquimaris]MCC3859611.1 beta-lactamase family protein [Pseudemcibacter aquimaris]WDU60006.1 beta-lactamase family protein [Pseudemcibacter aquimaris]